MNNKCDLYQKHFLLTILEPVSWNSAFVIHIFWKVDKDDRICPPIQAIQAICFIYFITTTLTFIVDAAKAMTYLLNLFRIPGNLVVPPLMTMLLYKSF